MEFSAKEEIGAPVDDVFAILSDIDVMERQALRRGVEVRRMTPHQVAEPGMAWQAAFKFRGRKRTSAVTLSDLAVPERMVFDSSTGGLETRFELHLSPLSSGGTAVNTVAKMTPTTLSARLLVQSMKLAKSKIARKYAVRMSQFAREIEERALRRA